MTGTGTISSATQQITGIDVSSLTDGTLTYSVTLTDTSGNASAAATATATLDKTAPTGYSITADDSVINAADSVNTGFTFIGTNWGRLTLTPSATADRAP